MKATPNLLNDKLKTKSISIKVISINSFWYLLGECLIWLYELFSYAEINQPAPIHMVYIYIVPNTLEFCLLISVFPNGICLPLIDPQSTTIDTLSY